MKAHRSEMWAIYEYSGHRVMVVQQWHDPFGKPMVRVALANGSDTVAEGMPERAFLDAARQIAGPADGLATIVVP